MGGPLWRPIFPGAPPARVGFAPRLSPRLHLHTRNSRDRLHRLPARPSQGPVRVHTTSTSVAAAVDSCAPRLSAP
jgi:hypothetical protein